MREITNSYVVYACGSPNTDIKTDLERLASIDGVTKYRVLPTLKLYKIGVRLDMVNEDTKMPNQPTRLRL